MENRDSGARGCLGQLVLAALGMVLVTAAVGLAAGGLGYAHGLLSGRLDVERIFRHVGIIFGSFSLVFIIYTFTKSIAENDPKGSAAGSRWGRFKYTSWKLATAFGMLLVLAAIGDFGDQLLDLMFSKEGLVEILIVFLVPGIIGIKDATAKD